jgi:hypothetical protein
MIQARLKPVGCLAATFTGPPWLDTE